MPLLLGTYLWVAAWVDTDTERTTALSFVVGIRRVRMAVSLSKRFFIVHLFARPNESSLVKSGTKKDPFLCEEVPKEKNKQ